MSKIENLLKLMWEDYIKLSPQAKNIVKLLEREGEEVVNDHIALRTFNHPKVCIDIIAKPFIEAGYVDSGEYHFEEKKLYAKHFQHPNEDYPKVFISELLLEKFSPEFNQIIDSKISGLKPSAIADFNFSISGRTWDLTVKEYSKLKKESDYGAWLSAIGYRPNHFTILINKLKKFSDIRVLNEFLKDNGHKLNDAGGEVKGSEAVCLEQSSTLADKIEIDFDDSSLIIPSCYFEFAKRYIDHTGKFYQGFVATSADKIFESTNKSQ